MFAGLRGRVAVGRRNLFADRRRLAASVLGVGLALMLVLLLDGLWEGVQVQSTNYPEHVGAQLYVAQRGTADFLGETSTIRRSTVTAVRRAAGVQWADPVRGQFVVFSLHGTKIAAYLVGYVPGHHGGPWSLADGRAVRANDEVVVDQGLARRHGVDVGDRLEIAGHRFHVVGLANAAAVMTGFLFMTHDATDELLRSPDTTSYVLVGSGQPEAVKSALQREGLTVLTRDEIARNDRALYTRTVGSIIRLMVGVAFVVGVLVIALTMYAAVIERRREYGVIKALGGTGGRIVGVVVRQTVALTAMGFVVGGVLYLLGRALIAEFRPQFSVVLTGNGLTRALIAALVMALLAAVIPARRVASAEPAVVYRGN